METAPTPLLASTGARRRTPEFQAWFQNSQVVTPGGEPLVVYHGTPQHVMEDGSLLGDLTEFDRLFTVHNLRGRKVSMDNVGSWFSTNPSTEGGAGMYAGNGAIYPVHLSIQNCFVTTFEQLAKKMHELNGDHDKAAVQPVTAVGDPSNLRAWLKASGFDGIKIIHDPSRPSSQEFALQDAWIPLDAAQIKSAVGNHGAYSPYTTDIRFSEVDDTDQETEHSKALDETGFWGRQAAGCVVLAKSTGRLLIAQRSDFVLEPGTWGTWGGAIDENEDPEVATLRELQEEAGLSQAALMLPLLVFQKGDFKYHNFLAVIEDEFQPELNWESQRSAWVTLDAMPAPLHPGLQALLADAASVDVICSQAGTASRDITETQNFKRWFADSKVVDRDGRPLRLFHGTTESFDSFSRTKDIGFHFGSSEQANAIFGRQRNGRNLMPVYLSIKNPLRLSADPRAWPGDYVVKSAIPPGVFTTQEVQAFVAGFKELVDAARARQKVSIDDDPGISEKGKMEAWDRHWTWANSNFLSKIREALEERGYDGIVYTNRYEGLRSSKVDSWVAFRAGQVKSSLGNAGSFDRENTDIRFSLSQDFSEKRAIQTETPAFKKWFSNSKVVDGAGKPLVVYHGTRRAFDAFIPMHPRGAIGNPKGIYFTTDKSLAEEFANDVDGATDEKSRIIEAYLSISNDQDGIIRTRYDGSTEYIVFDPTKIKSATDNSGEFQIGSADIRFSMQDDSYAEMSSAPMLSHSPAGTSAFKTWFGDSKIVDAGGKPLVVYHGTKSSFQIFRTPAWFSPSEQMAEFFSTAPDDGGNERTADSRVMAVYLRIANPVHTDDWTVTEPDAKMLKQFKAWQAEGHDGIIFTSEDGEVEYIAFEPEQIEILPRAPVLAHSLSAELTGGAMGRVAQTETPAFKSWFGTSKVVDDAGEPLLVYHGTAIAKNQFLREGGAAGVGAYFTDSKEVADDYARMDAAVDGDDPITMAVYLSLQNPLCTSDHMDFQSMSSERRDALEADGYDGVIGSYPDGSREYVAFHPEQIKSATGNSGAFEVGQPDIRFSLQDEAVAELLPTLTPADSQPMAPVQATEFQTWFDDSKVVDVGGRPLVVYHGTHGEFHGGVFGEGESIDGAIFFTDSPTEASWYATGGSGVVEGRGEHVMPVYLSIKNPYSIYLKGALDYESGRIPEAIEYAKRLGHDGLFVYGAWNGNEVTGEPGMANENQYVAFKPEQVKSALGNAGSYDPVNPDIRFSLADEELPVLPRQEQFRRTSNFDAWFGASKALDDAGRPLIMYHGTRSEFTRFRKGNGRHGRKAFYFHADKSLARQYGAVLMPVYVQASHPFDFERQDHQEVLQRLLLEDPDHEPWWADEARLGDWEMLEKRVVQQYMKENDFDSFYVNDRPGKALAVFQATQIKSATQNTGSFDVKKPDIRFSLEDRVMSDAEMGELTSGFENWFDGSQVVDDAGKPLVVYHGTRSDFTAFDKARLGESSEHHTADFGFFFSRSPKVADIFARDATEGDDTDLMPAISISEGAAIMPVHLSIKNPRVMTAQNYIELVEHSTGKDVRRLVAQLKGVGHDGIRILKASQYLNAELVADTWVAFAPEQIKSAIGNSGSYEMGSADIRFSMQDETHASTAGVLKFGEWFEDSKVVDREGNPLVVYHGSTKDIAKFRVEGEGSTYGAGVYFGDADDANSFADLGSGADGVVYPVYLSLRNPLVIVVPEGRESPGGEAVVYKLPEELRGDLAESEEYGGELRDAVIAAGYDGIIVHHGDGRSEYVAYHAEQIRSALSRTFDASASGIRFSLVEDLQAPVRRQQRFHTWFEGSKVVDANGAPLLVYRGEHGDTADGEPRTLLDSYTFTVDASVASVYAMQPNNWRAFPEAVSPRVIAAYLAIKNPVFFNDDDPFVEFSDLEKSLGRPLAEKMARKHDNDVRNTGNWEVNFADRFDTVDELLDHHPEALDALYVDAYVLLDDHEFIYSAKAAGFDGAAHLGNGESALVMEYRAFDKAQIKSATGNNGEFDPANPGIRFSVEDAAKAAVNFDAAVDQMLSPGANLREQILVSTAVSSLVRMGLPARPVYTSARVIEKMRMDHGLSALEIKSLPALLADPVMVFKSNTQDGRYVAVTDVIRNGKPLIVAIEPNGKAGRLDVMYVPSAYLKQDVAAFERWIRGGLLIYANKRKSQQLATTTRLKLPGVVQQAVGFSVAKYITERDMVQLPPKPAEETGTRDSRNSLPRTTVERPKSTIAAMRAAISSMVGMSGGELFQKGGKFIVVTSDQISQTWAPLVGKNVLASLGADPRSQPAQIARRAAVNVGDAIERSAFTSELLQQVASGTLTYHQANAQVMSYDRTTSLLQAVGKKSAQAFYDGQSGVTAFVADRIIAGEEEAVFMHETVHKYGLPALGPEMWDSLVARLKAWSGREQNSVERQIYAAAERRAGRAGVDGQVYDEELVAYACEEAVKRGIVPSAEAEEGSAEAWLSAVVDSIRGIGAKLIDNDLVNLSAQDLVDLTYALAQLNSPERAERIKDAMGQELDAFFAALKVSPRAGGPMWYSSLERALHAAPMNSAPAADWSRYIDGLTGRGIKTDEIEWSGVHEWLAIQSGRVLRAAVIGYLKDYGVRIDEVILGGTAATSEADQVLVDLDALGFTLDYDATMETAQLYRRRDRVTFFYDADEEAFVREDGNAEQLSDRITRLALRLQELRPTQTQSGALETTRYSAYTLPGGSNYSELLLTLPARFGALSEDGLQELNAQMLAKFGEGLYEDQVQALKTGQTEALEMLDDWEARMGLDVQRARLELLGEVRAETVFTTPHWDRPNVIAHVRFNERLDEDGAKCLFIEELQSDWGHEGKNKGFAGARPELEGRQEAAIRVRYAKLQAEHPKLFPLETPTLEGMMQNMGIIEMRAAFSAAGIQQDLADDFHPTNYSVPRGPFVGTTDAWLALVLKRIIKLAVDGGYERVAFVSGQQSVDRYDLSRLVDTIYYRKGEGPGYYLTIVSKERDETTHIDVTSADQLPEYVGQELAARIIAGEGELSNPALDTKAFRGLDLQLGGEGMKTFYDSIVPIAVTKLLRKLGGDGLKTIVVDDTHSLCSQVGFDITPTMRAKVTGGMPLFSLPADDEPFDLATMSGKRRRRRDLDVASDQVVCDSGDYAPTP